MSPVRITNTKINQLKYGKSVLYVLQTLSVTKMNMKQSKSILSVYLVNILYIYIHSHICMQICVCTPFVQFVRQWIDTLQSKEIHSFKFQIKFKVSFLYLLALIRELNCDWKKKHLLACISAKTGQVEVSWKIVCGSVCICIFLFTCIFQIFTTLVSEERIK